MLPTLQMAKLSTAAETPPPPTPVFPRSSLVAKGKSFGPQKSLSANPSNTNTNPNPSLPVQMAFRVDAVSVAAAPAATSSSQKNEKPMTGGMAPWEQYEALVDHVDQQLVSRKDCVVDATVVEGASGWTLTAYVKPDQLKLQEESLREMAQQAILDAAKKSQTVYVLGYMTRPFASMHMGFGCALTVIEDPHDTCWGSYSKGFCRSPGSCKLQHPKDQAGVNVMFKPSRVG